MDFKKFLPGQDEKESKEYYWAIVIEPGWVQAGVWRIVDGVAQIISSSTSAAWELNEELIEALDTALSSAIQSFPEDVKEPSKTVFGVVSSWVEEGQIKTEFLETIKNVCSELSLEPSGFVVLSEAIAHYLKADEGGPLNAVLLGIYKEDIEVSVFSLGNLVGSSQVARSVSIVDDIAEGLTRFNEANPLPSRFILYNGKDAELEDARQDIIKADWEDISNLSFLHTPKVELVQVEKKIYAVALAGASEIADVKLVTSTASEQEDMAEDVEEAGESDDNIREVEVAPEELGFELDTDVADSKPDVVSADRKVVEPAQKIAPEETDVGEKEVDSLPPTESARTQSKLIGSIRSTLSKFKFRIPAFNIGKRFSIVGNKTLLFGGVFFLLLIISSFSLWWYYPTATVTVYVLPQKLEENITIIIDPERDTSEISERILSGRQVESNISGDKTSSTTGVKTIGEKAKGEVKIFRVGPKLSLSAGTKIFGPSDLSLTLDDSIDIASGSAGSPGETIAKVTAFDIGSQYNLASGAVFTIANYSTSDVEAKNDSAFAGGTSKEISAISEEDQSDLKSDLLEELKDKVVDQLADELNEGQIFISESLELDIDKEFFSGEVGDEAITLKLNLEVKAKVIVVESSELFKLAQEILEDKVPGGFVLRSEQLNTEYEFQGESEEGYEFKVKIVANLLPEINPDEVAKKITGKYPVLAKDYLNKEVPGFNRAEIKIKPVLPGRLKTLPHMTKNIEVIISADK